MILPQQQFSCIESLSSIRNFLIWHGLRAGITPWLTSLTVTSGSFWILDAYSHLVPVQQKAMMMISVSRIMPVFCYGGLTQSCGITDTSLPELSSSVEHSRDRNLHNSSLEMRPRAVLSDAVWPGAGASSQAPTTPGCILQNRHSKATQNPVSDWYPSKLLATGTIYSVFPIWAQSSNGWKWEGDERRHEQPTGNHTQHRDREVGFVLECTKHSICKHYFTGSVGTHGRMPVHPRNTHKNTCTLTPSIQKQSLHLYTQRQCLWAGQEHTRVTVVFAGRI